MLYKIFKHHAKANINSLNQPLCIEESVSTLSSLWFKIV